MFIGLSSNPARAAGPWYITTAGDDSNSCLNPASPCATINGAIGKASSGDTIYVATGVYTSSSYEVVLIDRSITLSGGWDASFTAQTGMATIDGGAARRGITINPALTVTIERFAVQAGWDASIYGGGGIYSGANVTLNNSTINGNTAVHPGGGIKCHGYLIMNNSTVSGNSTIGGGIYSDWGGGISMQSCNVILNNSTVSGNTSWSYGGGIASSSSTLNLNNSTVSGNTARDGGGGILNDSSTITLNNSTVSGNSSGIGSYSPFGGMYSATLKNSILAGNGGDCGVYIISAGYNLIGSIGCHISGNTTGNIIGADPLLGPLQDNGGPTFTRALLAGSPAIDAGNPDGCTDHQGNPLITDQRGKRRVGRCDMGAYEVSYDYHIFIPSILKPCLPLYTDDFSNPASGWLVADDGDNRYEYLNGEYRILVRPAPGWAHTYPDFQASDYAVSVDLRNTSGVDGSYGIAFGVAGDWSTFYTLEIYPDGWYGIYRYDPSDFIVLSEAFSSAILQGSASNQIKVERNGTSINAYANGQLLASVTDGTYTGPRYIGLVVFSYDQPNVDIRFDNFTVYPTDCSGANTALSDASGGSTVPGQRYLDVHRVETGRVKRQSGTGERLPARK